MLFFTLDQVATDALRKLGTLPVGSCAELPSNSSNTLFSRYIVMVIDKGIKLQSLQIAFSEALRSADRMRLNSVVCNLIGSDM